MKNIGIIFTLLLFSSCGVIAIDNTDKQSGNAVQSSSSKNQASGSNINTLSNTTLANAVSLYPAAGRYTNALEISLFAGETGTTVFWSIDGGFNWNKDASVKIDNTSPSVTLYSYTVKGNTVSQTNSAIYYFCSQPPKVSQKSGLFTPGQTVDIVLAADAAAVWTTNSCRTGSLKKGEGMPYTTFDKISKYFNNFLQII